MVIAINPSVAFDFVCEADRELPPEKQTTWHLRVQTVSEEAEMIDAVRKTQDVGRQTMLILRAGIVGATNFVDADGVEIKWEETEALVYSIRRKVPTDAWLSRIPSTVRTEIANAITAQRVNEADRGKS